MANKKRVQYILFNVEEFMSYNSKLTESPFLDNMKSMIIIIVQLCFFLKY